MTFNFLMLMPQSPYTLTELIQNDDFIDWVLHPNPSNEEHWYNYLVAFPEKKNVVDAAKDYVLLLAVDTGRHLPSKEQSERMWKVVQGKLGEDR